VGRRPRIGNAIFVPAAEGAERRGVLHNAGVFAVVGSGSGLAEVLLSTLRGRAIPASLMPARETR
jgi:hypothetical protein